MKESYKSFDELPMMISVSQVAKVLGYLAQGHTSLSMKKVFQK